MQYEDTVGAFIRRERLKAGIKQMDLAENLCEPESLSRIESGDRTPRDELAFQLLDRLGVAGLSSFFGFHDIALQVLREELFFSMKIRDMEKLEEKLAEIKAGVYQKRIDMIQSVEFGESLWRYNLTRNHIALREALIESLVRTIFTKDDISRWMQIAANPYYDAEEKVRIMHEELKAHVKRGFSEIETMLINAIGATYIIDRKCTIAKFIYNEVRIFLKTFRVSGERYRRVYPVICHNLARAYLEEAELTKAVHLCEIGLCAGTGGIDSLIFLRLMKLRCQCLMLDESVAPEEVQVHIQSFREMYESASKTKTLVAKDGGLKWLGDLGRRDIIFIIS